MMKNCFPLYRIAAYALAISLVLAGCSSPDTSPTEYKVYGGTSDLNQLQELHVKEANSKEKKVSRIRHLALEETAMAVGAQSGLAWRSKQIIDILQKNTKRLDAIFNFDSMVLEHNVLSPVLVQASNTLQVDGLNTIRLSDRTYEIFKQARFVSRPPHWREYIWMEFPPPETPDSSVLPKTKKEQAIWQRAVAIGWQKGIDQANTIYEQNLSSLRRDYIGMALYRKLLTQQMVSQPYVARSTLGVTGNQSSIRINDQVLRITALPKLTPNSLAWQPVLTQQSHDN